MTTQYAEAERVIRRVAHATVRDYLGYWMTLVPRTHEEYYRFWLFSYMSVRQRWEDNVRGFRLLKELPHGFGVAECRRTLEAGRIGMFNHRARWLSRFGREFWKNPGSWYPAPGEPLAACRDRLTRRLDGLALAKVSFVLEMLCPASSEVVCLDSHMLRLYGQKNADNLTPAEYLDMEDHWLGLCRRFRKPSPMVRHVYWDRLRGKQDTRYWSYVLERPGGGDTPCRYASATPDEGRSARPSTS